MRTVRILSLDGGGMRGIFSATFLERFCVDAGIDGNRLWDYFDIITGTSIGGIQALAYSNGVSPTDFIGLLKTNGKKIFTIRFFPYPYGPAGSITLGKVLMTLDTNCYIYESEPLREALVSVLGTRKMFQLKTNVLVTSVGFSGGTTDDNINYPYGNITGIDYSHFSNVLIPGFTSGQNYSCVDVGVATGSAPVFFHPTKIDKAGADTWYIDGGLYQNNPTALAYAFSNVLFPNQVRTCVLSVGTGYSLPEIEIEVPPLHSDVKQSWVDKGYSQSQLDALEEDAIVRISPPNGLDLLSTSLNMTILGAQNVVDQQFKLMSLYNGASKNLYYYRFQSYLADTNLNQLDNPSNEAIKYLQDSANAQYDIDSLKIQLFIQKSQATS